MRNRLIASPCHHRRDEARYYYTSAASVERERRAKRIEAGGDDGLPPDADAFQRTHSTTPPPPPSSSFNDKVSLSLSLRMCVCIFVNATSRDRHVTLTKRPAQPPPVCAASDDATALESFEQNNASTHRRSLLTHLSNDARGEREREKRTPCARERVARARPAAPPEIKLRRSIRTHTVYTDTPSAAWRRA